MLRINLLPAYIAERRKTKATIALTVASVLAVTAAILAYFFVLQGKVTTREANANEQEQLAQQVTALQTEAQTVRSQAGPILGDVEFVRSVLFYNTLRQKIFRQAAAYTYRDVEYNQMAIQGQTLSIRAFAKKISDVGRFLILMFGNPDLNAVSVAGIPGWPRGTTGGGGGFSGGGYPGGGFPGGPGGDFPGGAPGDISGGAPGGFPGGGFPGGPGGGGFNQQNPAREGFPLSVTATLVQPVTRPPVPTEAPAGGGGFGGGFGGPGGPGGPFGPGGPEGDMPGGPPPADIPTDAP